MKKAVTIVAIVLISVGLFFWFSNSRNSIDNVDKSVLIRVETPLVGQIITSPVTIRGLARGYWFFEADFSIILVDSERTMIGETIAMAQGEWMTEDFVPFETKLYFEQAPNSNSNKGTLIFRKHNASGLPEHDDSFEIDVKLESGGLTQPNIEQEISLPYVDEKSGIRFEYRVSPKGYIIEEPPFGNIEDPDLITAILLTRIADYEEVLKSEKGREGPPTINIYAFESKNKKLLQWLEDKSSFTNFKKVTHQAFVMGGVEGVQYLWDGLYQGETVSIERDGKIYMIVGTYLSGVEDGRRSDFQNLVNSFGFIE